MSALILSARLNNASIRDDLRWSREAELFRERSKIARRFFIFIVTGGGLHCDTVSPLLPLEHGRPAVYLILTRWSIRHNSGTEGGYLVPSGTDVHMDHSFVGESEAERSLRIEIERSRSVADVNRRRSVWGAIDLARSVDKNLLRGLQRCYLFREIFHGWSIVVFYSKKQVFL